MSTNELVEVMEGMTDEDVSFIMSAHEQHSHDLQMAAMMEVSHRNNQQSQERLFGRCLDSLDRKDAIQADIYKTNTNAMLQMNTSSLDAISNLNKNTLDTISNLNNNTLDAMKSSNKAVSNLGQSITDTVQSNTEAMSKSIDSISTSAEKTISSSVSNTANIAKGSIRQHVKLRVTDQEFNTELVRSNKELEDKRINSHIEMQRMNNEHQARMAEENKGALESLIGGLVKGVSFLGGRFIGKK